MEADGTPTPPQVYEDFKPTTEWVHEDDLDTLLIYVPGFAKHQMKVQVVSSAQQGSTILRITGERRLHHNTWSRFRIEFPLSENCDLYKISAKFEGVSLAAKPEEESPAPMPTPQKPVDKPNVSPKTTDETNTENTENKEKDKPNTENKEAEKDQDVPEMSVQEKALENYKWAVGVFAKKLKTSKTTVDRMVILLVGLIIGIYVSNTIKSFVKV
nr:inactive protein restricted TEV movement 2-like [Tanacetum cinerariifolium]